MTTQETDSTQGMRLSTTGFLFAKRPWYSTEFPADGHIQVGELLTFTLEDNSALHVRYPYPRFSPRREFTIGGQYSLDDLGADYAGDEQGLCYESDGMRLFRIAEMH